MYFSKINLYQNHIKKPSLMGDVLIGEFIIGVWA